MFLINSEYALVRSSLKDKKNHPKVNWFLNTYSCHWIWEFLANSSWITKQRKKWDRVYMFCLPNETNFKEKSKIGPNFSCVVDDQSFHCPHTAHTKTTFWRSIQEIEDHLDLDYLTLSRFNILRNMVVKVTLLSVSRVWFWK